jgi:hypothetical protein
MIFRVLPIDWELSRINGLNIFKVSVAGMVTALAVLKRLPIMQVDRVGIGVKVFRTRHVVIAMSLKTSSLINRGNGTAFVLVV